MRQMYLNGYGVEKDYGNHLKWFAKSVAQDEESAQSFMGYMYLNGYGVSQNYEESIKWYMEAEKKGYIGTISYRFYLCNSGELY